MTADVDALVVSYGPFADLHPLLDSLRAQTLPPARIRVWHNGPQFGVRADVNLGADVDLHFTGENLGYGGALNRLFAMGGAGHALVVNPDVVLDPGCIAAIMEAFPGPPGATVVGGVLMEAAPDGGASGVPSVNAYGQRLTLDLIGINTDRGKSGAAFETEQEILAGEAASRYLGPSGALFAVSRAAWAEIAGAELFAESLFLYLEDVALSLKVRRAGGVIRFAPAARGHHAFSASTGRRSALKLYQVERNRLWLIRALWGRAAALASLPLAGLRMGAYLVANLASGNTGTAGDGDARSVAVALARAWNDGLRLPVPEELTGYLGPARAPSDLWSYLAPISEQWRDPTK